MGLFRFNLGGGSDTVDYSFTGDAIAAVVQFGAAGAISVGNVMVDTNVGGLPDRVDVLTGVENLVASTEESIIDLTNSTTSVEIRYNADDGAFASNATFDRDIYRVQLSNLDTSVPFAGDVEHGSRPGRATVPLAAGGDRRRPVERQERLAAAAGAEQLRHRALLEQIVDQPLDGRRLGE